MALCTTGEPTRISLQQPANPGVLREDLLLKIRAESLVSPEVLLRELRQRRDLHAERLAIYKRVISPIRSISHMNNAASTCRCYEVCCLKQRILPGAIPLCACSQKGRSSIRTPAANGPSTHSRWFARCR
jgi:hypothetical protein